VSDVEKRKLKLERMIEAVAKEQPKRLLAERKQREADRRADAHRKIELGGLVIAAGVDEWNEAEIVGALLAVSEQLAQQPQSRDRLRRKGLDHLEARAASRKAAKQ